jgi:hypothetical protein
MNNCCTCRSIITILRNAVCLVIQEMHVMRLEIELLSSTRLCSRFALIRIRRLAENQGLVEVGLVQHLLSLPFTAMSHESWSKELHARTRPGFLAVSRRH